MLGGYLAQRPGRVALAMLLLLLAKLAAVAVPYVLKLIVDALADPEKLAAVPAALLFGYAMLRFAGTLFVELRDIVFSPIAQHVVADINARAFSQLLALSPRFHAGRSTGALTREVTRGTSGMTLLLAVGVFTVVPTLVEMGAVMLLLLWSYGGIFTLILLSTFLFYTGFTIAFTARRIVHQRRLNTLDARAHGHFVDSLLNYETVKTHASEDRERARHGALLRRWEQTAGRNQQTLSELHVGQSAIIAAGVAAVMLIAGQAAYAGRMTVGDLVMINAFVIQVCLPLNAFGFVVRQARDALVDAERLLRLFEEKPDIADPGSGQALRAERGEVRFDRVHFGYDPERRVLRDITFRVAPGRTLAVVGGSGSGKSTLARLLLRLYDPDRGSVRIDGQDIRAATQASLRAVVGIVPQDTALFNNSIAFNIAYGAPAEGEVAMKEVARAAARGAQLHEFIESLPDGYDTVVGERGVKLSGGERQRIAIARLIARNPRIVIYDEATSALDARAERAIQAELDRLALNRTTLVIAHRLSTVAHADEIIVMERGWIVERGTHAELLRRGAVYAQMWSLQQQEALLPTPARIAVRHATRAGG